MIINTFTAGQFSTECHPLVGLSFAGCLLRYRCTAKLHVLTEEYIHQWHLLMDIS